MPRMPLPCSYRTQSISIALASAEGTRSAPATQAEERREQPGGEPPPRAQRGCAERERAAVALLSLRGERFLARAAAAALQALDGLAAIVAVALDAAAI